MFRDDYERFSEAFATHNRNEELFLQNYVSDPLLLSPDMTRICINDTFKWPIDCIHEKFNTGIYVDIFPLDYGFGDKRDEKKYLFFIVVLGFLSMDRGFSRADEFTFWGVKLKYLYSGGRISFPGSIHPGSAILWELFAEKTWIGYTESMAIWAMAVMIVSLLMPLYRFVTGTNRLLKSICLGILLVFYLYVIDTSSLTSIMADTVLGCSIAYTTCSIYEYLNEKEQIYLIKVLFGLCYMSTLKRSDIIFCGLLLMFLAYLCTQKKIAFWKTIRTGQYS